MQSRGTLQRHPQLPVFSIQPAEGRLLRPDDDQLIGVNFATVQLSHSMGLLIMSAPFLKSLMNMSRPDLSVTVDGISTFLIVPRRAG